MAKNTMNTKFSNAFIKEENGKFILTEVAKKEKDEDKVYNLTQVIRQFAGVAGLNITFSTDSELQPLDGDEEDTEE